MLTIVMHMTVKAGREDDCATVCKRVRMSTPVRPKRTAAMNGAGERESKWVSWMGKSPW
jgi:hypothetical protein